MGKLLTIGLALSAIASTITMGGCTIATPFRGPVVKTAIDARKGSAIVAITHARLGSNLGANMDFWKRIADVVEAAEHQPGYLGHSLRRTVSGGEAWTITIWDDTQSLRAFVRSDAHRRAMREGAAAIEDVRFVRLTMERTALPLTWERAEALLAEHSANANLAHH